MQLEPNNAEEGAIWNWLRTLTRSIRDPLNGTIRLSKQEICVIDHVIFRRLHRIRQNGLLYFVFPAATHTRFEHSLGVLHGAQIILESLLFNSHVGSEKATSAVRPPLDANVGQAVDFTKLSTVDLTYLFRTTRLAALVHDLGHGPLSHTFDPFAPEIASVASIVDSAPELYPLKGLLESTSSSSKQERINHDAMSCILFAYLWDQLGGEQELIGDVAAVLHNQPGLCTREQYRRYIPLMHDILASAPADADRMDYLERDSRSIGVTYGLFDRDRLLKSMLPYKSRSKDGQEVFRLGIKYSGLRAVENFIQARFELFVQIYYHKTNRAIELMLRRIAEKAEEKTLHVFEWDGLNGLANLYISLSDERFINILRGEDKEFHLVISEINNLADEIFNRKLWKRVFEGKPEDAVRIMEKLGKLTDETDTGNELYLDKADPKATKDLDHGAALLRRGPSGIYEITRNNADTTEKIDWLNESAIMKALAEAEKEITRIYLCSNDTSVAKTLRDKAREYERDFAE